MPRTDNNGIRISDKKIDWHFLIMIVAKNKQPTLLSIQMVFLVGIFSIKNYRKIRVIPRAVHKCTHDVLSGEPEICLVSGHVAALSSPTTHLVSLLPHFSEDALGALVVYTSELSDSSEGQPLLKSIDDGDALLLADSHVLAL